MATIDDIFSFLEKSQGVRRKCIFPDSDLCEDLGIDGDDFFKLEEQFAREFGVDMNGYLWYFHHGEEGCNVGSLFFAAPRERIQHIAVTPVILLDAANRKTWPLEYPLHTLPSRRYDTGINRVIVYLIFGLMALGALIRVFA